MDSIKQSSKYLRRRITESFGNPKYSKPGLNDLDKKLSKYLNFRGGFFIEAGANDGYSQSNTYYLEKILSWQGLLVEAVPELYEKCKKERRKAYVYNCALVAKDFTEPTIEIHYANLMSVVDGSLRNSEDQAKHLADGLKVQNIEKSYTMRVPARTLESILDELPKPVKIDFFSLDVEGYELNVLNGLNLEKYTPRYILVEANFFEEVDSLLKNKYEMIENLSCSNLLPYHDYLYRLKESS